MIERIVIFGASGDLTARLLMPAIAQLAEGGQLPPDLSIVGSAATDWSSGDFREHIAVELGKHATVTPATRDAVVSLVSLSSTRVIGVASVWGTPCSA